jgi:cyclopropane-fatty-acyl-phospholipid synthase
MEKETIAAPSKKPIIIEQEADGKWRGSSISYKDGQDWDKSKEMDFTYTNLDKFIRYSLGENAHFSNAFYDGDYSLTLEQARKKNTSL